MSSKKCLQLEHSIHSVVNSCYPRYQHTAKNSQHLKSQGSIKGCTIKSYSLKGSTNTPHSNHQTVKKNNSQKKDKMKKYIFYDRPQSKLKTQNSSLSCSTFKNIRMNQSITKDNIKIHNNFEQTQSKKKTVKVSSKTKRQTSSNDKNTLKIKKVVPKIEPSYSQILNRTKTVLEHFNIQRKNWELERQSYKTKISELYGQIDILKERIVLETPKLKKFHNFSIE